MSTQVLYQQDGPIGRITFSGPKGINILSTPVMDAIEARLADVARTPQVRVLILSGAERTFMAGADIAEMNAADASAGESYSRRGQRCMDAIAHFEHAVTIAAINGPALGGGCELAMACDLRVIANEAKIGTPEVKLGLIPGWGGTQRLLLQLGATRAKQLLFTGDSIGGTQALEYGLVNAAVPSAQLDSEADALARQILANGPLAVRLAKRATTITERAWLETGLAAESRAFAEAFASEQGREGLKAFIEKRPAKWS